MSGWLSRAKDAFGGREAEAAPEPVEIACPCGRKVEATRRTDFQRVLCKGCGEPFFLLPQDVYPRPVMKIKKVKPPKPPARSKSAAPSAAAEAAAPKRPSIDLKKELAVVRGKVRAQFTPLRLIVLSFVAVIGLTGWWQWTRAARTNADLDFKAATEAGQAALKKQDFLEAATQFIRASEAADTLQRNDVLAEQARQRARQLTAINSPMTRSLGELLEAAKDRRLKGDIPAVEAEFASVHSGHWIILEANVSPSSAAADPATVTAWEQPIAIDDETLVLTGTLPVFSKVPATVPPPAASDDNADPNAPPQLLLAINDLGERPVLFAAQVESLKWNPERSLWILTLKPSSAFLWTDYDLLLAAGIQPSELRTERQLQTLLLEQARWIGAAE